MRLLFFRKRTPPTEGEPSPSETLLRSVMAAFWLGGLFIGVWTGIDDQSMGFGFLLHIAFGVLLVRAVRRSADLQRVTNSIRWLTIIIIVGLFINPLSFSALSPSVAMLAAMRIRRNDWIGWTAVLVTINLISEANRNGYPLGLFDGFVQGTIIVAFATFSYSLVRTQAARLETQEVLSDLREAHERLREYSGRIEELAVADERNRIARELHDTLGHRLTVSIVQLEGAGRLANEQPERAVQMIDTVRQQLDEGLREVRATVALLRSAPQTTRSLSGSIEGLVEEFNQATGLPVELSLPDTAPLLDEAHRTALYRAAQEALTNIQRHAHASAVDIALTAEGDTVSVQVRDDGQGFDVASVSGGFGLSGMQERVASLGGEIAIESTPGEGTLVSVTLPLKERHE